jgi:hypothetical protein
MTKIRKMMTNDESHSLNVILFSEAKVEQIRKNISDNDKLSESEKEKHLLLLEMLEQSFKKSSKSTIEEQ